MSAGGSAGKRGATGPLVTTSDEEESGPDSPRRSKDSNTTISPTLLDHDYENVSSPGNSSTASGPTYVRQPGFTHHAHEVTVSKPRTKKKKCTLISMKDGIRRREPTPPKNKPKREPLPMRMRALPQSFWQQPNEPHIVSPATAYPILPPLFNREGEAVSDERPVTPTEDRKEGPHSEDTEMTSSLGASGGSNGDKHTTGPSPPSGAHATAQPGPTGASVPSVGPSPPSQPHKHSTGVPAGATAPHRPTERKITIANTDLLFKLFEGIEKKDSKNPIPHLKRGRPRKFVPCTNKTFLNGEDPYLMEGLTDKLFPQLSLEQSGGGRGYLGPGGAHHGTTTLQLVTLREGDKSITLPSLSIEQNYPQMLSELVMHI